MIETTDSYAVHHLDGWIFDRIELGTADAGQKLAVLLDKALYRHSLRWTKISPASKRWWRRQCGKHGTIRW